jgi:hypothetical protein
MLPGRTAPEGYHTVTPRMVVTDVAGAVQFLRAAFDGDRRAMVRDPYGNVFQIAHRPRPPSR